MTSTVDDYLSTAWSALAPGRDREAPFPRGFWPDVARLAVEFALGQPGAVDWTPTRCTRGNQPEPAPRTSKTSGKISQSVKAANTAALLALLTDEKSSSESRESEDRG